MQYIWSSPLSRIRNLSSPPPLESNTKPEQLPPPPFNGGGGGWLVRPWWYSKIITIYCINTNIHMFSRPGRTKNNAALSNSRFFHPTPKNWKFKNRCGRQHPCPSPLSSCLIHEFIMFVPLRCLRATSARCGRQLAVLGVAVVGERVRETLRRASYRRSGYDVIDSRIGMWNVVGIFQYEVLLALCFEVGGKKMSRYGRLHPRSVVVTRIHNVCTLAILAYYLCPLWTPACSSWSGRCRRKTRTLPARDTSTRISSAIWLWRHRLWNRHVERSRHFSLRSTSGAVFRELQMMKIKVKTNKNTLNGISYWT